MHLTIIINLLHTHDSLYTDEILVSTLLSSIDGEAGN